MIVVDTSTVLVISPNDWRFSIGTLRVAVVNRVVPSLALVYRVVVSGGAGYTVIVTVTVSVVVGHQTEREGDPRTCLTPIGTVRGVDIVLVVAVSVTVSRAVVVG